MHEVSNVNISAFQLLPTPRQIKELAPLSERARATVFAGRRAIEQVLDRRDPRLLLIVGPCSIHDLAAATEYASLLKQLEQEVSDTFVVLMRVYFTKPRTTVGWKGFISDPRLDGSFRIDEGLQLARRYLLELAEMGLMTGTEALDSIVPQYIDDLVSWNVIGARTAESQTHREMASGLSTPVGFKNGTDGSIQVALNAVRAALEPHYFLGISQDGQCAVLSTRGNKYVHVVLRGGSSPNYDSVSIKLCEQALQNERLPENIVVDCSHGNSLKNHELQPLVFKDCVNQICEGNSSIVGLMLESNLYAGRQSLEQDLSKLQYGVSVTDACIGWSTTAELIQEARSRLKSVISSRLG